VLSAADGAAGREPVPAAVRAAAPQVAGAMSASRPYVSSATGAEVVAFVMPAGLQGTAFMMVEVPMNELLGQLRGLNASQRLRLIDQERRVVVLDSRAGVGVRPIPAVLVPALSRSESIGTIGDGRAVSAFLRPSFLGSGLSGSVGSWVLTATDASAVPTVWGAVDGLSAGLGAAGAMILVLALLGLRSSARRLERLASTDSLTLLGNRRQLLRDLRACLKTSDSEAPNVLVLLDLDGFKAYNDAFGHEGGDNLLRRLAGKLDTFAREHGAAAYRLGGDEFCVLAATGSGEAVGSWAKSALSETGEAFSVTASWGVAHLPAEASTAADAMRLADERMYMQKAEGRSSAARQVTEVVVRLLDEREPGRGARLRELADLTSAVGAQMRLPGDELLRLRQATLLHRLGLAAVPRSILEKPAPLSAKERAFIDRHTVIAERVLAAAPSLRTAASLVRSTSERYDGSGHPDCLRGEEIPVISRIVKVCAAYAAMIEDRPYRTARMPEAALAELRRCAGREFDPEVVAALAQVLRSRAWPTGSAADPSARRASLLTASAAG
jgi:diguanylate cyclase (GGDEF)-like protein